MTNAANFLRQRALYRGWHNYQSSCQILRSQLGFNRVGSSRPETCIGCCHYHGRAYGQSQRTRVTLICGFHPYGWTAGGGCPDWQGEESVTEIPNRSR
ncbi:hypothetical protein V0288_20990 [Pannus brasiliensis CCIBt3594]|uniref:Uncharacterized protein n=1 Tax=Pannus brasiliensis CCIBt3594 TaxID=1427578 RepID=A0AAW9QY87_9CHRO